MLDGRADRWQPEEWAGPHDVRVTIVWVVLGSWAALAVVCAPVVGMALRRRAPGTVVEDCPEVGPVGSVVPSIVPAVARPADRRSGASAHGEVGVA